MDLLKIDVNSTIDIITKVLAVFCGIKVVTLIKEGYDLISVSWK